jgi:Cu/Ag efflux pump CusA
MESSMNKWKGKADDYEFVMWIWMRGLEASAGFRGSFGVKVRGVDTEGSFEVRRILEYLRDRHSIVFEGWTFKQCLIFS